MNGGYPGESTSLLPSAGGEIAAVRGGSMTGGGDPKEINLFGTRLTITDPSEGSTFTTEHEKVLSILNFKDKDDAEKRNLLQAIYNEGCDTNATLDLKSGCSPMRGLVTALAMKLLENMSASTASATTVGEDEGVVISMTIPIDKLSIALGAVSAGEEVAGNPDTWCVGGDDIIEGMNELLVTPLNDVKARLEYLKNELQSNIGKTIQYEEEVLNSRFGGIMSAMDRLFEDIKKIQGKTCESGGNTGSELSETSWISAAGHGDLGNRENIVENNEGVPKEEPRAEVSDAEKARIVQELKDKQSRGEPLTEKEKGELLTYSSGLVLPNIRALGSPSSGTVSLASPAPASAKPARIPIIIENNTENENENNASSVASSASDTTNSSSVESSVSGSTGGFYKKKRSLPNKTRRRVRFGETPIIKLF